jgi:hypothetical protein
MAQRVAHTVDVKTGTSDPADFAVTWIPITIFFVTYRGTSLRAANDRVLVFIRIATTL